MRIERPTSRKSCKRAFTLVELILVLTLLAIIISVAAPSLRNFFRGRELDSEARRLLSLTHAGQSRAVSEGLPMLLWIDKDERSYGLQEETSAQNGDPKNADPKADQFGVSEKMEVQAVNATPIPVNNKSLPAIRFMPDGTIDETSASLLHLVSESGASLWLVEATNRMSYEIRNTDK